MNLTRLLRLENQKADIPFYTNFFMIALIHIKIIGNTKSKKIKKEK